MNEMYQSDALRSGPMGGTIVAIRHKFLIEGPVDLTDAEKRFLLFAIQETFNTSHSPIVQNQFGSSMQVQGKSNRQTISSINQDPSQMSGSYDTAWEVMQHCMTKLGKVPPAPYVAVAFGPTGDPGGISPGLPNTHPPDDGTGYNHT